MKKQPRGFVALMSVVIISAILLLYVFGLGASGFLARFDALDSENQRIARSLAESCVQAALLKVAQNNSYAPAASGDSVTVSDGSCKICPGTNSTTIVTRALYKGAFSNIRATVTFTNGTYVVNSWSEDANGDTACTLP